MAVLKVENLNKYFRKPVLFQALKNISFELEEACFMSVMGKSGCGKSTLLYILSTMDTDYDGKLYINNHLVTGENSDKLASIRNEYIGFVFQFHYLLPEFSVLQNVMLPARKLGSKTAKEIEQDALEKLALLEIEGLAHKRANMISGGEKQRVAIARALINNPKIIMGDEPTGNLDSKNADNVFNIFRELNLKEKLSLLIVTHDEDFAKKSDRILNMEDGRIV
ncbi:MAG: ABC transporter ATP-binding protein [Vicingaceae bacterium]